MPDSSSPKSHGFLADGIFIREFLPQGTARGAFLLLHGMESHSGWFDGTADRLTGDGWAVVAFDRPGWGKSPGPRGHLARYQDFVEGTSRLASSLAERFPSLHLAGMSWGGMAALYLGLRRGWLFDSITAITPGLAARKDISLGGKFQVGLGFLGGRMDRMVTPVFRPEHFTSDPHWQWFVAEDNDRVRSVSASFCLETMKMRRFIAAAAGRRRLPPAQCLLAGKDAIIDNRKTGEICTRAGALVETLPDAAHTLIFERPDEVARSLSSHAARAIAPAGTQPGRVWIAGAGAVGGAMAALLARGGVETGVLVKAAYRDAMRENGIALRSGEAQRAVRQNLTFADRPEELPADPALLVLAVKSFDTPALLRSLAGKVPENCAVASLQNGVGNEDRLARAFPDHALVAASICASLEMERPGEVHWADDRGGLGAASHGGGEDAAREAWTQLMSRTGMECRWYAGPDAAARVKWSKLMLNIGFNALNSLTGMPSAALLRDDALGSLAIEALREGFAVMDGLALHPLDLPGFPVSKLRVLLRTPADIARRIMAWQAQRAPEVAFSMRQDRIKNRQFTEIQELNGKIVRIGSSLGIPTPANESVIRMMENF